jgi:NADH-quinone oxidoreductase subunit G
MVAVRTERGSITVPVEITDLPDRVVWLPLGSAGCAVHRELGVGPGALVTIEPAPQPATGAAPRPVAAAATEAATGDTSGTPTGPATGPADGPAGGSASGSTDDSGGAA